MAGSALARSFTEVTGTSIAWGVNGALKTLIPQVIGNNNNDKRKSLAIYFQRALLLNFIINVPVTLLQIYAGKLMCDLDEPTELCSIAATYCQALIPFLWCCAAFTSLQRIGQSTKLNKYIFISSFITGIISIPLNYLLVFTFEFGYIGTAITIDICYALSIVILIAALCQRGYRFLFIPLPLSVICTYNGIKQFIALVIPNMFYCICIWWMSELFILLAGYLTNPSDAIAASSILYAFDLNTICLAYSMNTVIAVRVGKYIGAESWQGTKKAFYCGLFIAEMVAIIMACIVWIFHKQIPFLWGVDDQIVYYASILFYVQGIKMIVWGAFHSIGGLLIGLGMPKYLAIILFFTMWCINVPLLYILLGPMEWRFNTLLGLITIWTSPITCRFISVVIMIIVVVYYVDIESVINKSTMRIKQTIKDYGSIQDNDLEKIKRGAV
eukprot:286104_1